MKNFILFLFLTFLLVSGGHVSAAGKKIYIVPTFENFSQYKSRTDYIVEFNNPEDPGQHWRKKIKIDQYAETARSYLQDLLVNEGLRVVERKRVDQIVAELGLTNQEGYINKQGALEAGKSAGASRIIMGSILGFQFKHEKIRVYGVSQDFLETICKIRVRFIDIESGNIYFSKRVQGKFVVPTSDEVENEVSDRALAALEDAVLSLGDDEDFLNKLR